jgi:hypothetical protein
MRTAALAVACLALVAGCGGGGGASNPGQALSATAANLGKIRSGTLHFKLAVEPREDGGGNFGFELDGPFKLAEPGKLPVAEIDYTQTAGDQHETVTLISTGEQAYIKVDDATYELSPARTDELRAAGKELGGGTAGSGLEQLRIDDWIKDPHSSGGGEVGGSHTDKIEADLDIVAAANDLLALAHGFGGFNLRTIEGQDAEQLRDAVHNAKLEVWTGDKDRLLRRLRVEAEFDPQLPKDLEELARAANSTVTFELGIDDPNEPVEVKTPKDVRPASELPN